MILRSIAVPIFLFLLACSGDKSTPVAPAGKGTAIAVDVLPKPANLRIEALSDTSVTVAWDPVVEATDYDLNYKQVQGGRWTNWPHRGAAKRQSTIHPLEPDTEYRWAVRAQNREGASPWVLADVFTTLADPNVVPPDPYIQDEYNSIYYLDWESFSRCDLYGSDHEVLISLNDTIRIAEFELDTQDSKVYWINENDRRTPFMRADLDGSNREVILRDAIGPAIGYRSLALDQERQVMYWINVDGNGGGLYRATLPDGRDKQEIFTLVDEREDVGGLTIDPETGRLYWIRNHVGNARGGGRIGASSITSQDSTDGSTYQKVVVEYGGEKPDGLIQPRHWGLSQIHGFTIDTVADKLYWSVSRLPNNSSGTLYWIHSLRRADLDGTNIETLVEFTEREEPEKQPIHRLAIDVLTGSMYFTRRPSGTFSVADLSNLDTSLELFHTSHGELPTVGFGFVQDFHLAYTPNL